MPKHIVCYLLARLFLSMVVTKEIMLCYTKAGHQNTYKLSLKKGKEQILMTKTEFVFSLPFFGY